MNKTPIHVLLIEDNPTDILLLREMLGEDALAFYEITTVERLYSAIKLLQKTTFDIILLDLGLPDSQGLETFVHLHEVVPEIPVVILSGLVDENLAIQAVHAGAQDYLVKGIEGFTSTPRAIRYAMERQKVQETLRKNEALLSEAQRIGHI